MVKAIERLKELFPDSSMTTLKKWITAGRVSVNGRVLRRGDEAVEAQDEMILLEKVRREEKALHSRYGKVVYEDQWLIIIDKREGVLSVATDGGSGDSLHEAVKRYCKPARIGVVHRLDRETSGLILFAKEADSFRKLKELLKRREIRRCYYAIVEGEVTPSKGVWSSYLIEDGRFRVHEISDPSRGEHAVTYYEAVETNGKTTLLRLILETGKKHQIRVHCKEAGCPVLGDNKYGNGEGERLYLHAYELSFHHPVTGELLTFTSEVDSAFKKRIPQRRGR